MKEAVRGGECSGIARVFTEATSAASAGVPLLTAHQEGLEKSLDENFVIRTYEIHRALIQAAKPSVASVFYTRVRVQVSGFLESSRVLGRLRRSVFKCVAGMFPRRRSEMLSVAHISRAGGPDFTHHWHILKQSSKLRLPKLT